MTTHVASRHIHPWWPEAAHGFPPAGLDAFLLWAAERGASDIAFQTGSPAYIEVDGALCVGRPARRSTALCWGGCASGSTTPPARASSGPGAPSIAPMPWRAGAASSNASAATSPRCRPGRLRRQYLASCAARRAAELRGAGRRGGDRRRLGYVPRPHAGDRRAGLGQVHPARRRHAAPVGTRRRAHPVLRGAHRVRLRRHRRRKRKPGPR